jgi:hypothetical protein
LDHATFLRYVGLAPPARLDALLLHLAGGSLPIVSPEEGAGLHPLVVPLAREGDEAIGLLVRPGDHALPVVRARGHQLALIARSTDEWLRRELAHRDVAGEGGGLLAAANRVETLYTPGEVALSRLPLNAWLLLKCGVNHAFFEELAELHLEKGDEAAALITAERSCGLVEGWARPHAFLALLLARLGKLEMARDAARSALLEPAWSLGTAFAPVARLAGWHDPITSRSYRWFCDDPAIPPLDRAARLLEAVAVEEGEWDAIRPTLALWYDAGGAPVMTRLVEASGRRRPERS